MLPIEDILPDLHQQLGDKDVILVAPPGAGKSTCLPLSLLNLVKLQDKKIILLQPRRVAVRAIAGYLAQQLGEAVGQTIGYRMKGEVKVSANTRIEIVTEGILTRMLQNQPELPDVGLVIFDEFHERSVHADFSLALCIEVQQALRNDLRLLVMSATLDVAALCRLMPNAKLLESKGKSFPVNIEYRPDTSSSPLSQKVYQLVMQVWSKHTRDCLVFLPGAADIDKTANRLAQGFGTEVMVCKLFADLSKSEQQRALQPSSDRTRKIVLATNIAETSLTIEGIDVVIDSGLEKRGVFQLNRGFTHLRSQKISQASATQRAGRAGRLGPGTCYRMWSSEQQQRLMAQSSPEILHSDMSGFILESLIWGADFAQLALIDQPADAQVSQGLALLTQLGAVNDEKRLLMLGKAIHKMGCHCSLATMLIKSAALSPGHQSLACALVALFENKDPLKELQTTDLRLRLEYLLSNKSHIIWPSIRYWHKRVGCQMGEWPLADTAVLVSFAFPQWIGFRTSAQRFLLSNGSAVHLRQDDPLADKQWLVIASMFSTDTGIDEVKVSLAAPVSLAQLKQYHAAQIHWQQDVTWDAKKAVISAQQQQKLGAITIQSQPLPKPTKEDQNKIWRIVIQNKGVMNLPFGDDALQYLQRITLAKTLLPELAWPDVSEPNLTATLDEWLMPFLTDVCSWQELTKLNFVKILQSTLDWQLQTKLDQLLPEKFGVPSGSKISLRYVQGGKVFLSVRMQELYGVAVPPSIAMGKILLHVELLSPAGRVLQTTQDLAGFWQGSYKAVQKEMKGRYQKHFWPDDPASAKATTKTKKRMAE